MAGGDGDTIHTTDTVGHTEAPIADPTVDFMVDPTEGPTVDLMVDLMEGCRY